MNLSNSQFPFAQFRYQKIKGILVFCEDQEFHLGIFKDTLIGQYFFEFDQFGFDLPLFQLFGLLYEFSKLKNFFSEGFRIN